MGPLAVLDQLAADGQPFFSIGGDMMCHEDKGLRSRRTALLVTAQIFKIDAFLPTMA